MKSLFAGIAVEVCVAKLSCLGVITIFLAIVTVSSGVAFALAPRSFTRNPLSRAEVQEGMNERSHSGRTLPAHRSFVTQAELQEFTEKFVRAVEQKLDVARRGFTDLNQDELDEFMRLYAAKVLNAVSAEMIPVLLRGRPLPTLAELIRVGYWFCWEMEKAVTKAFGKKYYFHPLGDYMGILADEILTHYSPEDLRVLPHDRQRVASWILLYNFGHLSFHDGSYEKNYKRPSWYVQSRDFEVHLLRPFRDLVKQGHQNITCRDLIQAAFGNRPPVERFLMRPSDFTPFLQAKSELNDFPSSMLFGLTHVYSWLESNAFNDPDATWLMSGVPRADSEVSSTLRMPGVNDTLWFDALFRMYKLPLGFLREHWNREIMNYLGTQEGEQVMGGVPVVELIRKYASIEIPEIPQGVDPMSQPNRNFTAEEERQYPLLTHLSSPSTEKLPQWVLSNLDTAINNAFAYWDYGNRRWIGPLLRLVGYGVQEIDAHRWVPDVVWTKQQIGELKNLPGSGSDYHKLIVLLEWHYGELFDIRAAAQEDGSVKVKLDPLFGVLNGNNVGKRVAKNAEFYGRIRAFLKDPLGKTGEVANVLQKLVDASAILGVSC